MHCFFLQASEYARVHGIPRLFLAANSGARIGMAQSLKNKFRVCFVDEQDPSKGFKYIYVDQGQNRYCFFAVLFCGESYKNLLVKVKINNLFYCFICIL